MKNSNEWDSFTEYLKTKGIAKIGRNSLGVITNLVRESSCALGFKDIERMWETWQASRREGYVSVPKIMSAELAHKLAEADFRDINPMFNYEHRGLTSEQKVNLQSKWIRDKAIKYQILYQTLIGVTDSQHKHSEVL